MDNLPSLDEVRSEAERRGCPVVCREDGAIFSLDEYVPFASGNYRVVDIRFVAYPARWHYTGRHGTPGMRAVVIRKGGGE